MSNAISFSAPRMAPLSQDAIPSRSIANASDVAPVSATEAAPVATAAQPPLREETTHDPSGLTVFRTVDAMTGDLVAQFPTEAYLRLANAMKDAARSAVDPSTGAERTA